MNYQLVCDRIIRDDWMESIHEKNKKKKEQKNFECEKEKDD